MEKLAAEERVKDECRIVACYGAAGYTFGTVTADAGVPAAIVGFNAGLGVCMVGCVVLMTTGYLLIN
jgi:hypothetical protein